MMSLIWCYFLSTALLVVVVFLPFWCVKETLGGGGCCGVCLEFHSKNSPGLVVGLGLFCCWCCSYCCCYSSTQWNFWSTRFRFEQRRRWRKYLYWCWNFLPKNTPHRSLLNGRAKLNSVKGPSFSVFSQLQCDGPASSLGCCVSWKLLELFSFNFQPPFSCSYGLF